MKRLALTIAMAISLIVNITSVASATTTPAKIDALGPGTRIHGMDISYYQHPGNAAIDFKRMYAAGIRFVIIKGGDSIDANDAQAVKYMIPDRIAAQAASMYTSFYYYAYLPNVNDQATIIKDAKAQAQKIIWRIASLGGYSRRDLPVALDLENNCVAYGSKGCTKY
ncbi:MAG TPA: GH25 family lysozyme, partial [Candidatus Nanopelagicaceae bacterium]